MADILERLERAVHRFEEIDALLCAPETAADPAALASLMRRRKQLLPVTEACRRYRETLDRRADTLPLLDDADPDIRAIAKEELAAIDAALPEMEQRLRVLLLPPDPNDGRNVIVEIRAGAGGEESALFAADLTRMYTMYNDAKGFTTEIMNENETELGGLKEVVFTVAGDTAWSRYKFESGVHRVQRVPVTESGGRIHTSTVTVAVLPEVEPVDFKLDPADLIYETYRASGAGGQKVNKTSSAVRVIHVPTGTVVECQVERSQYQNKDRATELLRSRLYNAELQKSRDARDADRRGQVGTGDRSEKIRTYNYPQDRVTDHRIGLTLYKLGSVMNGDLDEIIDALIAADTAKQLESEDDT